MNREAAKRILLLHRPGLPGDGEPEAVEAFSLLERDAELRRWFEVQQAAQAAIRREFRKISPPEAFKEQIISERPWHTRPVTARHLIVVAAVFVGVIALGLYWMGWEPREDRSFAAYRGRMVGTAQRTYVMQLATNDLASIRGFLEQDRAPGDFAAPNGLTNATPTGCLTVSWRGSPVAMICFKTGQPLPAGQASDLWFFVIDHAVVPDAPASTTPQFAEFNHVTTASWTRGGKTYVLAVAGEAALLKSFL